MIPAPGQHFKLHQSSTKKGNKGLVSRTGREAMFVDDNPGPEHYEPTLEKKKISFHLNHNNKWIN
jgi:hypothetical protein